MASKIGIALFKGASPFSRGENIACEYGGTPFEFSSSADLPSHALWVTNVSSDDIYAAGLHRTPRIASDGYFRTRLSQIVHELGLQAQTMDHQAAILAEMLGCAAEMLKCQLGLTQSPAYGMAQAVGQLYGSPEPVRGTAVFQVAEQSAQRFTACERTRRYEQADVFSYWYPRNSWASEMLQIPLPSGDIKLVPRHSLPAMGENPMEVVKWAYENNLPLFARVKIHGLHESIGNLMNYGAGAQDIKKNSGNGRDYDARNFREWCALPELEFIASYGDVEIQQIAIADGWQNSGLRTFDTKRSAISYAYGLAAENLWVGTLRKNSGNFNLSKTLSTAWLQAEDRMRCLLAATKLQALGMEITTYGNGRIGVVCPKSVRALIPQAALELGLLYPAVLKNLSMYPTNKSMPLHIQQLLITSGEHVKSIQVDQACLKELESARHAAKHSTK
ncbi:hypothetical protein [Pseudomonas sp. UMAB-40]|uniref:hypothetical protein n=1 Tax=Pseudomonas sp. UMAB-40 TaxID=1365407 RepID=UPI001C57358C|nr:hypothetical protein [Pseudomonas sp. UMAB-40]